MAGESAADRRPRDADTLPPWPDGCTVARDGLHAWGDGSVITIADPPHIDYTCAHCRYTAIRATRDERDPRSTPITWRLWPPRGERAPSASGRYEPLAVHVGEPYPVVGD